MGKLQAAVSSDIDTLASIYKGYGCRRGSYTYTEMTIGLENFSRFLQTYSIKATFFVVGSDLYHERNTIALQAIAKEGHEIANHTMNHIQGFRTLSPGKKRRK